VTGEAFEDAVDRMVAAAVQQGFGRYVTDPTVLNRIAGIVAHERDNALPPRRRPWHDSGAPTGSLGSSTSTTSTRPTMQGARQWSRGPETGG
jgi:hypothetical protein